jgi:hypothetical protein
VTGTRTSPAVQRRIVIESRSPNADSHPMERSESVRGDAPGQEPECVVCGRNAVTIDRNDAAMCAKHAAIFVTTDRREAATERGRIVR